MSIVKFRSVRLGGTAPMLPREEQERKGAGDEGEQTPAPGSRRLARRGNKNKGLSGVEVERVPPLPEGLADREVCRVNTYKELYALLVAAMTGVDMMRAEVADPELFARAWDAVRKLRDALVREGGADGEGMPYSPFGGAEGRQR